MTETTKVATTEACSIFDVPSSVFRISVLSSLGSSDLLSFRLASRGCYEFVHGLLLPESTSSAPMEEIEGLWGLMLARDFQFVSKHAQPGESIERMRLKTFHHRNDSEAFLETKDLIVAPTAFTSWKHWRKVALSYQRDAAMDNTAHPLLVAPFILRAADFWKRIEEWCASDVSGSVGDRIQESLIPGKAVDLLSSNPNLQALQSVWAFYAGQHEGPQFPPSNEQEVSLLFSGLLGGYSAYDHSVSTKLVPAMHAQASVEASRDIQFIPIARSYGGRKRFDLHVATGKVLCSATNRIRAEAAPPEASNLTSGDSVPDAVLIWLEEYARRLHTGVYQVGPVYTRISGTDGILLFPTQRSTEWTSRAVTRGIEVVASSVLAPDMHLGMSVYSIRIRMLSPGEDGYVSPKDRGFTTCQLCRRHWKITTTTVEHVNGDGVIGMYPLLREGSYSNYHGHSIAAVEPMDAESLVEGVFVYQSCTQAADGTFEGELQFVPGSLAEPTGDLFDVRVAPFPVWGSCPYLY